MKPVIFFTVKKWSVRITTMLACVGVLLPWPQAVAQSYSIDWCAIAPGGTSTGGTYSLSSTIAEPGDSPALTGGTYLLAGGFWPGVDSTAAEPGLSVSPAAGFVSDGIVGGPFLPASQSYLLSNSANTSLSWTISKTANWLALSSSSGTLPPHGTANIGVAFSANAFSLSAGNYWDILSFANTSTGSGNTTRLMSLSVSADNGPGLTLKPKEVIFLSAGPEGGPFAPLSQTYILSNSSSATLSWTSYVNSSGLLTLSPTSGTLAPGATAAATVSINTNLATTLAGGGFSATVYFTNATTGVGTTYRNVNLTVYSGLSVSPEINLQARGTVGGPFSPERQAYELRNLGNRASLNWRARAEPSGGVGGSSASNAINLSATAGTLGPGARTTVTVSINSNADQFAAGNYGTTLFFDNTTDGRGNTMRSVNLLIDGGLTLLSTNPFVASGPLGGPFTMQSSGFYQLHNDSSANTITWTVEHAPRWLNISLTSGLLAPNGTVGVFLALNTNANSLPAGNYPDTISFRNSDNSHDVTTLSAGLSVGTNALAINFPAIHYTVLPGATVNFSVTASGLEPISYAWYRESNPIPGATSSTLTLRNVAPEDAGRYQVHVSNPLAARSSDSATLAVFSLKSRAIPLGSLWELSLVAAPGSVYRIDYTDRLGTDSWQEFGTFTAPLTANDFGNSQTRFYRAVYLRAGP